MGFKRSVVFQPDVGSVEQVVEVAASAPLIAPVAGSGGRFAVAGTRGRSSNQFDNVVDNPAFGTWRSAGPPRIVQLGLKLVL